MPPAKRPRPSNNIRSASPNASSLLFCPHCGTLLVAAYNGEEELQFICCTCPYLCPLLAPHRPPVVPSGARARFVKPAPRPSEPVPDGSSLPALSPPELVNRVVRIDGEEEHKYWCGPASWPLCETDVEAAVGKPP